MIVSISITFSIFFSMHSNFYGVYIGWGPWELGAGRAAPLARLQGRPYAVMMVVGAVVDL
jgi:hypothetical protein